MKLPDTWNKCEACGLIWRAPETHTSLRCEKILADRRDIEAEFERMAKHQEHHAIRGGK